MTAPAQAATWVITNGTLDAGTYGIGGSFSGTIDFDANGITSWSIDVYNSNGSFTGTTSTSNGSASVGSNGINLRRNIDSSYNVLTFSNLTLQNAATVNLAGQQSFCNVAFGGLCGSVRNITGGVATLSGSIPSAVPEPAAWVMMIAGFGLIGGAVRRRRTTVRYA